MPWTEEDIRKKLTQKAPSATDYLGGIFAQAQKEGDAFAMEPLYPGAPPELAIPKSVTDTYRAQIKASDDPLQTESRLKAAYLASQMYGIPVEQAYDNYESITQELYRRSMQPNDWLQALGTTWKAAVIGTSISKAANELWKKGPNYDYESDPLWQQIQQYQVAMPLADDVKRSLPVEVLKRTLEFVPSMISGMDDNMAGRLVGGAVGAILPTIAAAMLPGVSIPLLGITAIGATIAGTAATTTAGARLGGMIGTALSSRDMERGAQFYQMLTYTDPQTGQKLNPKVAWQWANAYATTAGVLEAIEFDTFFKGIPDLTDAAKRAITTKAKDMAKDTAEKVTTQGIFNRHFLQFISDTVGRAGPALADINSNALQEAAQEAAAVIAEEQAKKMTNDLDGTTLAPAAAREIGKRLVDTYVGAFLGTAGLSFIPGAMRLFVNGKQEVKNATVEAKTTVKAPQQAGPLTGAQTEKFENLTAQTLPAGTRFQEVAQVEGERYTMKAGDAQGKLLNAVTYDIEPGEGENPGTVTILGMDNIEDPAIARATIRKVAQEYAGWDIQWEPATPGEQALKDYLVRTNPRGAEAGLQLFRPYSDIDEAASMERVTKEIQAQRPGWKTEDIEAGTYFFQKAAQRFGMDPTDLVKQSLAPFIVGGMETDSAESFGASYRAKFENGIRTVIELGPKANPSTLMHEMTHAVVWFAQANRQNEKVAAFLTEMENAFGIQDGNWDAEFKGWTEDYKYENRSYYEAVAYALEDYLAFKKAPEGKEGILAKLAQFVVDLYNGLKKARVNLSPEIESYFDKLLGDQDTQEYNAGIPEEALSGYRQETAQNVAEVKTDAPTTADAKAPALSGDIGRPEKNTSTPNALDLDLFQGEVQKYRQDATTRLARAKEMEGEGYSPEDVKQATGWAKKAAGWVMDKTWKANPDKTQAPEFRRWFGESKARDESGKPMAMFHSTKKKYNDDNSQTFGEFSVLSQLGAHFGTIGQAEEAIGLDDRSEGLEPAAPYRTYPVYLSIKNPLRLTDKYDGWTSGSLVKQLLKAGVIDEAKYAELVSVIINDKEASASEAIKQAIVNAGYDGIVYLNRVEGRGDGPKMTMTLRNLASDQTFKRKYPEARDSWIAFYPEQIKSTNNRGTWNPKDSRILYQGEKDKKGLERAHFSPDAPVWRYKTEDVIEEKLKGAMPGRQILKTIQAAGVKADEIKWTGLDDFLDTDEKKTPQEVKDFLAANKLQIQEVERSNNERVIADPAKVQYPKYSKYTIPGGENYREILFTLPPEFEYQMLTKGETAKWEIGQDQNGVTAILRNGEVVDTYPSGIYRDPRTAAGLALPRLKQEIDGKTRQWVTFKTKEERLAAIEKEYGKGAIVSSPGITRDNIAGKYYSSSHWDEPNVLAHTRLDDRTTADGKRVLFVEEIQSDWHQEGRRDGYQDDTVINPEDLRATKKDDAYWEISTKDGKFITNVLDPAMTERQAMDEALRRIGNEPKRIAPNKGVPSAPFAKTWHEFVFKRILRMAADGGYDAVAWTTGEQQAERYDLSKQIASIQYGQDKNLRAFDLDGELVLDEMASESELENIIGKEAAEKLVASEPDSFGVRSLHGQELKVGGEGMKGFYDKMLVDFANKYGKKWGAQVQDASVPLAGRKETVFVRGQDGTYTKVQKAPEATVHALPVTDAMLESVGLGQYLFQGTPDPKSKQYESWHQDRHDAKFRFGDVLQAALKDKYGIFDNAINIPYIGPLTIHWGYTGRPENDYHDGYGLAHILIAHEDTDSVIANLENILTKGLLGPDYGRNSKPTRRWITWNGYRAIIELDQDGQRKPWLVTAFLPESEKARGRMPLGSPTIAPSDPQAGSGPRPPEAAGQNITKKRVVIKRHLRPNDILSQGKNVYHGSGAGFGRFDSAWIGTGEQAQAYGWGLYFTESQKVAKTQYADRLGSTGYLRTTLGDTSSDKRSVRSTAETLEDVAGLESGTFTGKNIPLAQEATEELNKAVRRRISELGLDVPMLTSDEADFNEDRPDFVAKREKQSDMILPAVKKAIEDTLEKYRYDAEFDPEAKTRLAYAEALGDMIEEAASEGAVALVGGRFMYNAELALRGENPGEGPVLEPKGWRDPVQETDIEKLRKEYLTWMKKKWTREDFERELGAGDVYDYWADEMADEEERNVPQFMGGFIENLEDNILEEYDEYGNTGEGLYKYLKEHMFNGNEKALKRYLERAEVTSLLHETIRSSIDKDGPLQNTLIRWDKPLYDDQKVALKRFFDGKIKEMEAEGLPEMAESWADIASILVHMEDEEGNNTGGGLYKYLADAFEDWSWEDRHGNRLDEENGPRVASDMLYQAGFDGIQYPVAFLTGGSGEKGWNYVMFDDDAISIKRRTLYQGEAPQSPHYIEEMKQSIAQGQSFDEIVEFFEAPFIDQGSWGIPDLPTDKKLAWYREQYDALTSPEKEAPVSLEGWLTSLKKGEFKGLREFMRAIYEQVIQVEDSKPGPWADKYEVEEWSAARDEAYAIRKQIAGPVTAAALAVGAKNRVPSQAFIGSVYGIIAKNPEEYAAIYAKLMGDEGLGKIAAGATKEKYADIQDPAIDSTMSISQKRELAEKVRDKEMSLAIRSGKINLDDATKEYVVKVENERKAAKTRIQALESEIKEQEASLDANTRTIAEQRMALKKTEDQINRTLKRITTHLDEHGTVPAATENQRKQLEARREKIRQKLVDARDWMEINRQYEEAKRRQDRAQELIDREHAAGRNPDARTIKARSEAAAKMRELQPKLAAAEGYRTSQDLQTYLARLEERTKLQDEYRARAAEKKAITELRAYRKKIIEQTLKEPAESANVEYKKAISAIQAVIQHKYDSKVSADEREAIAAGDDVALADAQNQRIQGIIRNATKDPAVAKIVSSDWLAKFTSMSRREIPLSMWEEAHQKVTTLRKIGREAQIQIEYERQQAAEALRASVEEALMANRNYKDAEGPDTTKTLLDIAKDKVYSFEYAFKNARRFLRDMDGGVDGQNVEFAWHEMNRHYREETDNRTARQKAILDAIAATGHNPKDWYEEIITIPQAGKNDTDAVLRKSDLMALALGFRDEYSRQALLYGNFFSEDEKKHYREIARQSEEGKEFAYQEMEEKAGVKFAALIQAINEKLDESDWALLDDVFEKDSQAAGQRLAEVVADVENKEMVQVEHYFPILRKGVTDQPVDVQIAGDALDRVSGLRRPPKNGFTKERIGISPWNQGETQMDLLGTWLKSIEGQEHYMAFAKYGRELDAVYLDRAVLEKVKNTFGAKGAEYLKEYLTEVKNPTEASNRKWHDEALQMLRGNLGAAYLGYRVSSVMKQLVTSPWPALPYAGPGLFVEAAKMITNPIKYVAETESLSTVLKNRSFSIVAEAIKHADAKTKLGQFTKNVQEMGMKGLEWADRSSVAIGWRAIYNKALEEFDGDHQKAMEKADDIILMTQPASRSVDLAPAYRNKDPYRQAILQFTQALNVVYQNIRYDIPAAVKAHQLQQAIGIAVAYVISGTLLQAMISRPPKDDEPDEEKAKRYAFWAITQATDSIPFLGEEVTRIMKRAITGEKSTRYADSGIPGIAQFMDGLYSLSGDDDIGPALEKVGRGLGMLAGAPVSGVSEAMRVIGGDAGALIGRKSER
jgi:uncharacterized coiled-coil protein SlyX